MAIKIEKNTSSDAESNDVSILSKIESILSKDFELFGSKFSDKKKEFFYHEIYILLSAGIDIKSALELLKDDAQKNDKKLYDSIYNNIISGGSLSEALKHHENIFTPYEYYSIKIGEETGKLTQVLKEIADFFNKKIKQKRQITSSLTYPVIVLITAMGAVFFMIRFIVPMFSDVFLRFKGDLPFITKLIITFSAFISKYLWVFLFIIISITLFIINQKQKLYFRKYSSLLILKIPFVNELVRKIYLTRLCQSLSLLTASKVPLVNSISLVQKMINFYPVEISLLEIEKNLIKGQALHVSMQKFKVYDKRIISLIKVAEETNQLEIMFGKIAQQYSDEIEHKSSVIGNMLEPIIIIFLGIVVAVILISMYLPLFELSNGINI
jgi:type IV pilus assembly protein PilC